MAEVNPPLGLQAAGQKHPALLVRRAFGGIISSEGIASYNGANDLKVTAGANLDVDIARGGAFVEGDDSQDQGFYFVYNDATVTKTHDAGDAQPRKDLIVAHVRDNTEGQAGDNWILDIVKGTPDAAPVEPTLPDTALKLAVVDIPASASAVGTITDSRSAVGIASAILVPNLPVARARDAVSTASPMSTTEQTKLTATLEIPSDWAEYDVDAWAKFDHQDIGAAGPTQVTVRLKVGGTTIETTIEDLDTANVNDDLTLAILGATEGLTTTGSRLVTLTTQLSGESGNFNFRRAQLIAYAWRTA